MSKRRSQTISDPPSRRNDRTSPKSRWLAFAFAFLFMLPGLHRFYVGKFWTGFLFFLTGGGLGLWWVYDVAMLAAGRFEDSEGRRLGPATQQRSRRGPSDALPDAPPRDPSVSDRRPGSPVRDTTGDAKGRDGAVGTPDEPEDVRIEETDDVEIDEEKVMRDPLEKEFEELEREFDDETSTDS